MDPLPRHRRQPPDSYEVRGVHRRARLPSLLLHVRGSPPGGGGYPPEEGLRPAPDARPACGKGCALSCILFRAPPWEKAVHFKQAVGSRERASFIIKGQMESDHPPAPVEEMTLVLSDFSGGSSFTHEDHHIKRHNISLSLQRRRFRSTDKPALLNSLASFMFQPPESSRSM